MFLGLLVLVTALSISAVAIYYSVSGLVAIFAAAAVPIMIMGSVLEIGKLVTAVWLHTYWKETKWWLKTYLSVATIILMFITSMGIFGFLSKAHIEQTANAQEGIAQIERIDIEIARQQAVIERAEERILDIESKGSNNDAGIQEQIDTEQQRIDSAYTRIQPAINEQLAIVTKAEEDLTARVQPLIEQAATIETTLTNLSTALANNEVRVAQGIVGARQDGSLGPNTSARIQAYREAEEAKRTALLTQVEQIRTAPQPIVESARAEISRLRSIAEQQIANSDQLIARLRDQLGVEDTAAIESAVAEQQAKVIEANTIIDTLTENKYTLQAEYRKLEAEVGPVKYLAEFIYGETANQDLLEEAVRWVIIIIIFVFDPLAVLLLIASQFTFDYHRQERIRLKQAQQEINNDNESNDNIDAEYTQSRTLDDRNRPANDDISDSGPAADSDAVLRTESGTADNGGDLDIERQRLAEIDEKEKTDEYKTLKQNWKEAHPDQNIKFWKDQYIKGKINVLPWENNE